MTNLDIILKKQRHHFAAKDPYIQSYSFSSSHALMWELDHKEGWVLKNWCFQTVVLEKTLENPLDSKEIILVNTKGNQLWVFIGRTDAEAPKLWPPDTKSGLTGKDPDAGNAWRQKKEVAEDEMVDGITESTDMNLSKLWEIVEDRGASCATVHGVVKSQTGLSDWTITKVFKWGFQRGKGVGLS